MSTKLEKLQFVIGLIDKISNPLTRIQARLHALGLEQMALFRTNFHSYGNSAAQAARKVALITAAITAAIAATGALVAAMAPMMAMGGAGIGAAIGTANTAGVARESALLQQQTGIDTATLQQYRLAGRAVGVEGGFGELGDSGKILTEVHTKISAPDDALAKTLQQVQIPLESIKGLKADEVLNRVVAQTQKLGMTDVQASAVLESLAGDASKLLPLLKDNAATLTRFQTQSAKTGAIITPEQAKLMQTTNTEWALMKTGAEGYGNILSEVGGNFMKLFGPEINNWFADNADAMRQWSSDSVKELQRLHGVFKTGGMQAVYEDLFPNLSAFTRRVGAFVDGFTTSFASPFMRTVETTWARVSAVLGNTAGGAQGFGSAFGAAILPVMAATMEAIGDAVIFLEKNWDFVKQLFAWSPLGLVISNWGAITDALEPVGKAVKDLADYFGLVAPGVTESGSAMGSLVGILAAVAGVLMLNNIAFGAAYHVVKLYRGVIVLLKAPTMIVVAVTKAWTFALKIHEIWTKRQVIAQKLATAATWAQNLAMKALRVGMIAMRAVSLVGFLMTMGASMAAASVGTWSLAGAMALLTSPIVLIVAGLAALAAGAYYLYTHWAEVKAYLGETAWGQALLAILEAVIHPVDTFNVAVAYLSGLWASTKASLAETTWGHLILTALNALFSPFETFQTAINAAKGVWDGIKSSLADTSWGQAIIGTIQSILGYIDKFTGAWANMKAAASEKISGAWGSMKAAVGFGDSPASGGGRAVGGLIRAGVPYRINERVPEVLMQGGATWVLNDQMARIMPMAQLSAANSPVFQPSPLVDVSERVSESQSSLREMLQGNSPAPAGGLRSMITQNTTNRERMMMQNAGGKRIQIGSVHLHISGEVDAERILHELEMAA